APFDLIEHPDQYTHVLAVARPEIACVRALPEPVDVENGGRVGNSPAHLKPVAEIISHVVSAERKHRHRVVPEHVRLSGRGRRGARLHSGAEKGSMAPVEGLEDERYGVRPAPTKNDGRE